MRVLVVDDDPVGRELLQVALSGRGWEVILAADGVEGLEFARREPVDVAVSDILMPRMDGYSLCREWHADPVLCSVPFIFYTATYTSEEDEALALRLGADGFIVKPQDVDTFIDLVSYIVDLQATGSSQRRSCEEHDDDDGEEEEEEEEVDVLRQYSERLVRKLEDRLFELEQCNRELQTAFEALSDETGVKERLSGQLDTEIESSLADYRDRFEDQVEQRTRELSAINQRLLEGALAKSAFLANMGHAMRNQLNSIIGFSGIIQQGLAGPITEEQKHQIDMIYTAGRTLLALVNDVVDLSKIEAGQMEVKVTAFDLLGFLEEIVESFRKTAEGHGVRLRLDAPSGVIPLRSDKSKLEQVVRNLMSNAIKFTPSGTVTVEAERTEDGGSAIIRVKDTGEGIAPEVMARIFEEFVKLDGAGSRKKGGTGLGLAITRRLCEMLGGSVSARTMPGEGSVFTVLIPVDLGAEDAEAESERSES